MQITPPVLRVQRRTAAWSACSRPEVTPRAARRSSGWPSAADVVIESFRPGVVDRLGIGYDAVRGAQPAASSTARRAGYGQTGPRSQWAGHDLNYLAVGGYLDCTGRGADGRPPLPGPPSPTARAAACTR